MIMILISSFYRFDAVGSLRLPGNKACQYHGIGLIIWIDCHIVVEEEEEDDK